MSQYSLLLINHDLAGSIEKDPKEFWRNAWHAITQSDSVAQPFGIGSAYPVGVAVCQDTTGNSLRLLLTDGLSAETIAYEVSHHVPSDPDAQLAILRIAAKKLGYKIVKIPEPKVAAPRVIKKKTPAKKKGKK